MIDLEDAVNEKIRECVPVTPVLYHDKDDPKLAEVCNFSENIVFLCV